MQPEFTMPDFMEGTTADEIHQRMMNNLPDDIDDMPGGFPYDMTMPAAVEKEELINYHLVRALMIAFPQYAWDDWLDLHGQQVHLERHDEGYAQGTVTVEGTAGVEIPAETVFCTAATDTGPSIEFSTDEDAVIPDEGVIDIAVTAVESGTESNVRADTVVLMLKPLNGITSVRNMDSITGGTERESNDDFFDRIAAEYDNSLTYLGNDNDYIRWSKEAGAGDCIVDSAADGPGTVTLILVDGNGQPANQALIDAVYDYIVSEDDRSKRLLPTACAKLTCKAATNVEVTYSITGLSYDETTTIDQIKEDFSTLVKTVYTEAKTENVLRYNDVRPLIAQISGVVDFDSFLMNSGIENIILAKDEYPITGDLDFS